MDTRLIAWARAVKARRRLPLPTLWLFTDERRLPDPLPAVARLPPGLAGVVFRHDEAAGRAALGRALARLCRARRLVLVVAGDVRLAANLHAGLHHRRGRRTVPWPRRGVLTASAHDRAELARAARAGADIVFLGPAFATASHPGQRPLGPVRWNLLARRASIPVAALGGVTGKSIRALPRAAAAAAIGALA
ncbi:MAG: thiamine phosphate synthase [Rhodospirillales bacterium]|nr:thiamine phosphate synthase [Rhodospirillales bacterium]